jgi:hypothetical protein
MANRAIPHEKRKGEAALSDFAEYVEQQQALRYPGAKPAVGIDANPQEHHAELDELFDNLDLGEATAPGVRLRDLLLGTDEDTLNKLKDVLGARIEEGHGETVFDLGYENNNDSLGLTLEEWNVAYKRLEDAAQLLHAECQALVTRNVGGDVEAPSAAKGKDKDCTGKIMIRRKPETAEDVIETRIAVVGNGESESQPPRPMGLVANRD